MATGVRDVGKTAVSPTHYISIATGLPQPIEAEGRDTEDRDN